MGPTVYFLGALTTVACAIFLLRGYIRGRKKLLLWSGLCFVGLGLSNLLVFVDLVLIPDVDLFLYRLTATTIAMGLLLFGLIWEGK